MALNLMRNMACRLRNARPNHQASAVPPRLTVLCKLLVACVIAMGPFLGIAAAAVMGARPTDPLLLAQSMQMRKASVTVCTACRANDCVVIVYQKYTLQAMSSCIALLRAALCGLRCTILFSRLVFRADGMKAVRLAVCRLSTHSLQAEVQATLP
jgi:hypothetical protein